MLPVSDEQYLLKIEELEARLAEAEQLIEAIKAGEVDAFAFTNGDDQHEIFTLQSGDYAYRVLVENFNGGAVNLSEQGLIVYTNRYFHELLGLSYEDVIGRPIQEFIHPSTIEIFQQLFDTGLNGASKGEILLKKDDLAVVVYVSLTSLHPQLPTVGMIITDLTDKKEAEKDHEMSMVLQNIFRQAPAAIALLEGPEHVFVSANQVYLRMCNRTEEQLLGKKISDVFPEIVSQGVIERFDKVYQTGIAHGMTEMPATWDKNQDGVFVTAYFNSVLQPIKDEKGKVLMIMSHVIDVTEQLMARKKIEDSEAFNRTTLESSPDCVKVLDLIGRITYMNEKGQHIFEIDDFDTIKNKPWTDLWGEENREVVKDAVSKSLNGETAQFQAFCPTAKGKPKWWDVMVSPIRNAQGEVMQIISVSRDITDNKKAEEAIRQSEKEFRHITDALPQLVWVCNNTGETIYLNDQWYRFTGTGPEQNLGFAWLDQLHLDDRYRVIESWRKAQVHPAPWDIEFRIRSARGEYRWMYTKGVPFMDNNGRLEKWFGTCTDIHERKNEEQRIIDEDQRKTDFIKMVSHELKTPITSIKGYVQLMLAMLSEKDSGIARQVQNPLVRIDNQVERLGRLISEILDVSKLESAIMEMDKEEFQLDEFLEQTIQDIQFANPSHRLTISEIFPCTVHADKNRIGQAVINLVNNAIKYSPDQQEVELRLYRSQPDLVGIAVKDRGIGIDESEHEKIFQRFYRAGESNGKNYTGFGIGLYIVNEIVQRHGGHVTVNSKKDQGSVFTIFIPCSNKTNQHEQP